MARRNRVPNERLKLMLEELEEHYGEPVKPVSTYCEALETWARALETRHNAEVLMHGKEEAERHSSYYDATSKFRRIRTMIHKSNLLYRLIYCGEKFRTRECPVHLGHWNGHAMMTGDCPHQCDGTGFLREKEPDTEKEVDSLTEKM
jgi:hypothetical protein